MLYDKRWGSDRLIDLNVPSLEALSHILRHRELWPKDFYWSYSDCKHCAVGLANELWDKFIGNIDTIPAMEMDHKLRGVLSIDQENIDYIFWGERFKNSMPFQDVTPEMVADAIDQYLRGE